MESKIDDGDDTFIEVSNSSAALGRSPAKAPGLSLNLGREGGRVDADEKDTSAEGVMTRQLETQVMVSSSVRKGPAHYLFAVTDFPLRPPNAPLTGCL